MNTRRKLAKLVDDFRVAKERRERHSRSALDQLAKNPE